MRKILAVLTLGTMVILTSAAAFADDDTAGTRPSFYGDGFDHATCVSYTVPARCVAESLPVSGR